MKKLKRETNNAIVKGKSNIFRLNKENKTIKYRIHRGIRNHFEQEEEHYCKPVIVNNFYSNSYIEHKRKRDRKTLSVKKYLTKIKPFFKDAINNIKKPGTWKIQLTITINFVSSKNNNDDLVIEVIEELLKSLHNSYQNNLMEVDGN